MMSNRSSNSPFNYLYLGFRFCVRRLIAKTALNLLPTLAFLFIQFSLPFNIYAETFVSGNITQNTTWTLAESPYIITGDLAVRHSEFRDSPTATLTIEPGVVVRFEPGTGLYIGYRGGAYNHSWFGALFAQGTESAPITFTSNAANPAPGDWKGIYFGDTIQQAGLAGAVGSDNRKDFSFFHSGSNARQGLQPTEAQMNIFGKKLVFFRLIHFQF